MAVATITPPSPPCTSSQAQAGRLVVTAPRTAHLTQTARVTPSASVRHQTRYAFRAAPTARLHCNSSTSSCQPTNARVGMIWPALRATYARHRAVVTSNVRRTAVAICALASVWPRLIKVWHSAATACQMIRTQQLTKTHARAAVCSSPVRARHSFALQGVAWGAISRSQETAAGAAKDFVYCGRRKQSLAMSVTARQLARHTTAAILPTPCSAGMLDY